MTFRFCTVQVITITNYRKIGGTLTNCYFFNNSYQTDIKRFFRDLEGAKGEKKEPEEKYLKKELKRELEKEHE